MNKNINEEKLVKKEKSDDKMFMSDLIKNMLEFDPNKRWTAE